MGERRFLEDLQELEADNRHVKKQVLLDKANNILTRLLAAAEQKGYAVSRLSFKLAIVKHFESNGRCYAGGQIILGEAWVKYAPEPVLAGLIAHEVAHALLGHGALTTALGQAAESTAKSYGQAAAKGIHWYLDMLVVLPYSRRVELDADLFGCRLMKQSGYPISGMAWQKYVSWCVHPTFIPYTHPTEITRIITIIRTFLS